MRFFIVDAFSDRIFGGNPAGVVLVEEFPTEGIMCKTAAELRYSETAFVRQTGEQAFHIRYFTPTDEVDLCGHATIAAFYVLAQEGLVPSGAQCRLHTLAGDLTVEVSGGQVLMEMGKPVVLGAVEEPKALETLYHVMGAQNPAGPVSVTCRGTAYPLLPALVSTGLPDIILPLSDPETLHGLKPDYAALTELSRQYACVGVHAFAFGQGGEIHCRNFAPLFGIDEEAATGTANGALTYYLYQNGLLTPGEDTVFTQGLAMNRPSRIMSRLHLRQDEPMIQIGGECAILAEGKLFL